jgi:CubicO group peptidase (beta-lactamase class C family)
MAASGALRSDIIDMLKYLEAQINPPKKLKEAIELTQKQTFEYAQTEVALGWHILKNKEKQNIYQHSGATAGYNSFTAFSIDKKLAVVILTNSFNSPDKAGMEILKKLGK